MAASERPILYGRPMVLAYFADLKTQTRRIVKPQPTVTEKGCPSWGSGLGNRLIPGVPRQSFGGSAVSVQDLIGEYCPYGQPGDLLRGKEAAWVWCRKERDGLTRTGRPKYLYIPVGQHVIYQADHPGRPTHRVDEAQDTGWRLKIGRYLPKWASRMRSEVVSIRVERVQDISEADAAAEGVPAFAPEEFPGSIHKTRGTSARERYRQLWISINGQESWDSNPWVWVVIFRRVEAVKL